jgi:glutathione S-transferase
VPFTPSAKCRCCATAMSSFANRRPSPLISIAVSRARRSSRPIPRLAALTEQWVSLVNTVMDGTLIRTYLFAYIFPKTADGKPDGKAIEAVTPAVREQLGILERAVAKTGYLVSDQFTFADINLLPILYYVRQLPEGVEAFAAATHLAGYYDRHAARPSFKSTTPPPGPPRRATPR